MSDGNKLSPLNPMNMIFGILSLALNDPLMYTSFYVQMMGNDVNPSHLIRLNGGFTPEVDIELYVQWFGYRFMPRYMHLEDNLIL